MNNTNINTKPLTEEQLVTLCQQEDPGAQEELYGLFANKMFRICLRYLPQEDEAEDSMIKGFVKAFNNIHKFEYRGKGSLEGWVKRIIVNECLMEIRKRKMQTTTLENIVEVDENADAISQLQAEDLYSVITKLPNGYRTVFNMHIIEGYAHKEIAEILNVSENTSKSQLSKAKAMLRRLITENEL
ncbi:MAG: sigma-70 family RNA polymerase sigma factor [bacterium]|nr:sigma-70 family RNA polymerase sigma factor [bacterium]